MQLNKCRRFEIFPFFIWFHMRVITPTCMGTCIKSIQWHNSGSYDMIYRIVQYFNVITPTCMGTCIKFIQWHNSKSSGSYDMIYRIIQYLMLYMSYIFVFDPLLRTEYRVISRHNSSEIFLPVASSNTQKVLNCVMKVFSF